MLTLTPVVRANTVWIMLHHSACTEQMTLIWPLSWACAEAADSSASEARAGQTQRVVLIVFS